MNTVERRGIVSAINLLLFQATQLSTHYRAEVGESLVGTIPTVVTEPDLTDTEGEGIVYGANGLSAPRADGAVRSRALDEQIDLAMQSSDRATKAWGDGWDVGEANRASGRWVMITDTLDLPGLTQAQRDSVLLNCSNASMMAGLLGNPDKLKSAWAAYGLTSDAYGVRLSSTSIVDAFAVIERTRAEDMGQWAKNSLAHFLLTSGAFFK